MKIFLAGGVTGNLFPFFRTLSGKESEEAVLEKLNIFLAESGEMLKGFDGTKNFFIDKRNSPYALESFAYMNDKVERLIPWFKDFMLDSGAFTFLQQSKAGKRGSCNWDEYAEKYATFVKEKGIEYFFELDIDSIVGYKKVKELRNSIEKIAGRQPIPVWHKSRGKEEFLRMCDEYKYVALGGIVIKEITKDEYKYFPWFIREAHRRGCKIHGLGFTNISCLPKYHFDSVDSTAWLAGNQFGFLYQFDGKMMKHIVHPKGMRFSNARNAAIMNYCEWMKFLKFAETHL